MSWEGDAADPKQELKMLQVVAPEFIGRRAKQVAVRAEILWDETTGGWLYSVDAGDVVHGPVGCDDRAATLAELLPKVEALYGFELEIVSSGWRTKKFGVGWSFRAAVS